MGHQNSVPLKKEPSLDLDLIEVKLFLQSSCFAQLEETIQLFDGLVVIRQEDTKKFDIESERGQKSWDVFLKSLHNLCTSMDIQRAERKHYIDRFSKAYKILYTKDNTVYLPEIFDSAQEGYSYLWVNGEKYIFSEDVLKAGVDLKSAFYSLKQDLEMFRDQFKNKVGNENVKRSSSAQFKETKKELNEYLETFDKAWSAYERNYILELMVIEKDSRRFIVQAIDSIKQIQENGDDSEFEVELISTIWKINAIANTNGKGRDDLEVWILKAAQSKKSQIDELKESKDEINPAFDKLVDTIQDSYSNLKLLFIKYSENIEVVDPQLKNNPELVEALVDFENSWSKGKMYLLDEDKFEWFIALSRYISYLMTQYPEFESQVECWDYELFMTIPSLIIQKAVFEIISSNTHDGKFDITKQPALGVNHEFIKLVSDFCPELVTISSGVLDLETKMSKLLLTVNDIAHHTSKSVEDSIDSLHLELKGALESGWISGMTSSFLSEVPDNLVKDLWLVKPLSMQLQRSNPTEWNELLDICMVVASK